jgi:hypothetical protein
MLIDLHNAVQAGGGGSDPLSRSATGSAQRSVQKIMKDAGIAPPPRPGETYTQSVPGFGNDSGGDVFLNNSSVDNTMVSLRPKYGMADPDNVMPSATAQRESDLRFDMFDVVRPGYGEGQDNKLFVGQVNHDRYIRFADPLNSPGGYIGQINGATVPPWQLQRVIPPDTIGHYLNHKQTQNKQMMNVLATAGEASNDLLGNDQGYPFAYSSSGLKRPRESMFEPVIRNDINWEHVKNPTGHRLNNYQFRRDFDAMRYPRDLSSYAPGTGGPHLPKRSALEVILQ